MICCVSLDILSHRHIFLLFFHKFFSNEHLSSFLSPYVFVSVYHVALHKKLSILTTCFRVSFPLSSLFVWWSSWWRHERDADEGIELMSKLESLSYQTQQTIREHDLRAQTQKRRQRETLNKKSTAEKQETHDSRQVTLTHNHSWSRWGHDSGVKLKMRRRVYRHKTSRLILSCLS